MFDTSDDAIWAMGHITSLQGLALPTYVKVIVEGRVMRMVVDEGKHLSGELWAQLHDIVTSLGNSTSIHHHNIGMSLKLHGQSRMHQATMTEHHVVI